MCATHQILKYKPGVEGLSKIHTTHLLILKRLLKKGQKMAAYACEQCGMSIGTMTCGECGAELVHETFQKNDGTSVHVSKCPEDHGMVKSPMCCGQDMECDIL